MQENCPKCGVKQTWVNGEKRPECPNCKVAAMREKVKTQLAQAAEAKKKQEREQSEIEPDRGIFGELRDGRPRKGNPRSRTKRFLDPTMHEDGK